MSSFIPRKSCMLKFEWKDFMRLVLLDYQISLNLICDGKKNSSFFFFLNRPLLLPQVVKSDFEIKEFYLTSESDVTYFIYLQANYVHILLSKPHQ